ncbi:hypothetical protein [Helicobacter sp. MIT 05-5294]|nr:hypothetical protein [Helicobacter sp. MIT 05-5294]
MFHKLHTTSFYKALAMTAGLGLWVVEIIDCYLMQNLAMAQ